MHAIIDEAFTHAAAHLTPEQVAAFERYQRILLEWNARFNLTAIRAPDEVRVQHFLDSLTCLRAMEGTPMQRVVDVGTGAGFPGLVLKIARPQMRLTLVESVAKKAGFCRHVVEQLAMDGVDVVVERVEVVGHQEEHREGYDWALARAVASLPVLAEYLLPLVRVGGRMLAQMGAAAPEEVNGAAYAFRALGGRLERLIPIELPGMDETRHLVVVEKLTPTPEKYPRRTGIPAKRPLMEN